MKNNASIEPNSEFIFTVQKENLGMRLDQFVSDQFDHYSRNFFRVLIEDGLIKINEKIPSKPGVKLKPGDVIHVTFPAALKPHAFSPETLNGLNVDILHREEDFLVLNKPAGLLVHRPCKKSETISLVDWLIHYFNEIQHVGYEDRPGIVHRLDKDTSGLMLVALTQRGHSKLSELFKNRKIKKTYLALVKGHPEKEGTISFPIGRHHTLRNKMAHVPRGREATTHYKVLEYFDDYSLLEVKPTTGRTHQIRVHFSSIGHPLAGDLLYAGPELKPFEGQALHAQALEFEYNEKPHLFLQKPPKYFELALLNLQTNKNF